MRAFPFVVCVTTLAAGMAIGPGTASAQTAAQAQTLQQQIDQLKKDFGDRLAALEAQLAATQAVPAAPVTPPAPPVTAAADAPVAQPSASNVKVFNPDMAVIGDFLGAAGRNRVNPSPAMEMHNPKRRFRPWSIHTRAPTSSSPLARKASSSRKGF